MKLYRYKVTIKKDDLSSLKKINLYNLKKEQENITFYTNSIKNIKDKNFNYIDFFQEFKIKILKKHFVLVLSYLFILLIFLTSSFYIRKIEFKNSEFDLEIYEKVLSHLEKVGPIYKIKTSLNEMGRDLRVSFPHFAYIGVYKESSKLFIEIVDEQILKKEVDNPLEEGNIVSKYDAYITSIISKKGTLLVSVFDTVKKGDVLIKGNKLESLKNGKTADGIILGRVCSYEQIIVKKQKKQEIYTGKIDEFFGFRFFKKEIFIGKNHLENIGYTKAWDIFSVGFIALYKCVSYEKKEILITYDLKSGYDFALSKIKYDFYVNKTLNEEKILNIDFLKYQENDDFLVFFFLVDAIRNIAKFIPE